MRGRDVEELSQVRVLGVGWDSANGIGCRLGKRYSRLETGRGGWVLIDVPQSGGTVSEALYRSRKSR